MDVSCVDVKKSGQGRDCMTSIACLSRSHLVASPDCEADMADGNLPAFRKEKSEKEENKDVL